MQADPDRGPGDESRFSAEDLEHLYRLGGLDPTPQIRGHELNDILHVHRYDPNGWYTVSAHGVQPL